MFSREALRYSIVVCTLGIFSGCAATRQAEEYGSNTAETIFACPGENWTSKKLNETFCLMTSVKSPYNHVLAEDTAEAYGDSVLVGVTLGISTLFDGDVQEKWLAAAKEFANDEYGDGARVINFRQHNQYKSYAFEVIPPPDYENDTEK